MKTEGVKRLMESALASLPVPHSEDVIEDVFLAIEQSPKWRQEYEELCTDLTKTVVNTWGGFWIANHEGRSSDQQVPSRKSTLIGSYTKLSGSAVKKASSKIKEPEALQLMSDYYQEHKSELPERVRTHRELIVDLLMGGMAVEDAFSMVLKNLD